MDMSARFFARIRKEFKKIPLKVSFYVPMFLIKYTVGRRKYNILFDAFFSDITGIKLLRVILARNISALKIRISDRKELGGFIIDPLAKPETILSDLYELVFEVNEKAKNEKRCVMSAVVGEASRFIWGLPVLLERGFSGFSPSKYLFIEFLMREGLGISANTIDKLRVKECQLVYYPIVIDVEGNIYEAAWKASKSEVYYHLLSTDKVRKVLDKRFEKNEGIFTR